MRTIFTQINKWADYSGKVCGFIAGILEKRSHQTGIRLRNPYHTHSCHKGSLPLKLYSAANDP
ncbi:hypothetical protein QMN21_30410, partial [Serratia sp. Se-PFBMAAmG]|nr:hypothetical protein [Serratia sp. Se-PFBMAAmG]